MALRAKGEEGHSLPGVFSQLADMGAHFRRSQLSLVAAAPGGGKSAVASHLCTWMAYESGEKVPTLYFSADSDKGTLGIRMAAGVLDKTLEETEALLEANNPTAWRILNNAMSHVWLNWNPAPGYKDIEHELEAYVAVTGEYPHLIIVDNLKNMVTDSGGAAHEQYDEAMEWLKILASETKAHVLVLHHVTGQWEDATQPIPLTGLLGKPGKACRLIITLYMVARDPDVIGMCIVKNSNGKAAADASLQVHVSWMPQRSYFADGARRH